ncbi:uncharacterized protein LOC113460215 isoform X1 [Zonotrichia albicollis]|uniref:uncharacterized protein LOC113460215 isoform X1 n=1 Tax=Zonotrichia albicollis TaxID=44394 RepID=UPI003D8121C8
MSPTMAFILALLATPTGQKLNLKIEKDDVKRMLEREEYLHQEMTRLLQEIDEDKSIMERLFLSLWQLPWLPLVIEALLLSLAFWLVRRWKRGSPSCRMQEGSSSKWNIVREKFSSKEKVSEHEKDKGSDWGGSTLAVPSPSPMGRSRIRLECAVSNLISLGMSLLIAVGLHWMVHKGHSQAQLFCDSAAGPAQHEGAAGAGGRAPRCLPSALPEELHAGAAPSC